VVHHLCRRSIIMLIDLHIHSRTGSDGAFTVEEIFKEAIRRHINFMSITDHDSIAAQATACALAQKQGISYMTGIELNVTFEYPGTKPISLDFLGYNFDAGNPELLTQLEKMRLHREERARLILEKLNIEFDKEHKQLFTEEDMHEIQETVEGALGRPHIANYLIKKGIVADRQEAFDKYLVKCDAPKYPLSLAEASRLIHDAGGVLVQAHANDPGGTSLATLTTDPVEQTRIMGKYMLQYMDGLECWHPRHDMATIKTYVDFCKKNLLLMTGGSDCHQKPVIMGSVRVPDFVSSQFKPKGVK
jgi:3',5'-nucleoside bisphosphate phosphatase